MINTLLFKFLWNRHYGAPKAVERIKREIINTKISHGGFGMLDIRALDESIKLRAVGRIIDTRHPFLRIVKERTDIRSYFNPVSMQEVELMAAEGIGLLREERVSWLENPNVIRTTKAIALIKGTKLRDILSPVGRQSLEYFRLNRANRVLVADLDQTSFDRLSRHIDKKFVTAIRSTISLNVAIATEEDK
jgi:precorrin-6x reductase